MKKTFILQLFILVFLFLGVNLEIRAEKFFAVNQDNDTIYYSIEENSKIQIATVTYPGDNTQIVRYDYKDTLRIPEDVTHNGINYKVTIIGKHAFDGCRLLRYVLIPQSVHTIENYAFYDCVLLNSINLTNEIKDIGVSAFENCRALETIVLPNHLKKISNSMFRNCVSLSSIIIPQKVETIESFAFMNCSKLSSIILPEALTLIDNSAFRDCISLTVIDIPQNVKTIRINAFAGNVNLNAINLYSSIPPRIYFETFDGVPLSLDVYIHAGSISNYQKDEYWNKFVNIQPK
ncbi:MAG: leucine-rich repeat domain-containing protein [Bacteroidales bacterium]|jgi:hypothetical protein|nr:leucine-rich repeat domain-containing protein [Bacteroidales bacterium]